MYGDETQNELMNLIKQNKEEGDTTMENEIQKLTADIEVYKEAIENATIALEAAEMELDDAIMRAVETEA